MDASEGRNERLAASTYEAQEHDDGQDEGSSADLFLSLAQNESESDSGEGRHTRQSLRPKRHTLPAHAIPPSQSNARPQSSPNPLAHGYAASSFGEDGSQPPLRSYGGRNIPPRGGSRADYLALSEARVGTPQGHKSRFSRDLNGLRGSTASPDLPPMGRRRPSITASEVPFSARNTAYNGEGRVQAWRRLQEIESASPAHSSNAKKSPADSDSIDSNTAPSTVWDELDDLKSRIKKLELTGKLPPTSSAAIGNPLEDRPRTATTAPTTISSSPQRTRKSAAAPSEVTVSGTPTANIHPLLQSALAKSKPLLSPSLYRALEASANDALALAALTGSSGPQGTAFSAASMIHAGSDRQIRRKAESMCRNLTDLCIALCEGKSEPADLAVKSSPLLRTSESPRYARHSMEPEPRNAATSRLSYRRSSLAYNPNPERRSSVQNSPRDSLPQYQHQHHHQTTTPDEHPSPSQTKDYASKYERAGTSLLRVRPSPYSRPDDDESEANGDRDTDPTFRAPSRAMTELPPSTASRPLSTYQRRDFGPGTPAQRSPSLRDTLTARRGGGVGNLNSVDNGPDVPRSPSVLFEGGNRYLSRAPSVSEAGSAGSVRRNRIASLGGEWMGSPSASGGGGFAGRERHARAASNSLRRNFVVE